MLVKFAVIAGSASKDLGKLIARRLKAPYVEAKTRIFPDGESKITFGRIPKNSIILVVQSTYPPVDTNLLQTLSIISQARKASSRIYAIIPYMGYARQDRQFLSGEVVTMSIVARMLQAAGAKKIVVVDIHSKIAAKSLLIDFKILIEFSKLLYGNEIICFSSTIPSLSDISNGQFTVLSKSVV